MPSGPLLLLPPPLRRGIQITSSELLALQPTRPDQLAQGVFDGHVQHRFQFRDQVAGRRLLDQGDRRRQQGAVPGKPGPPTTPQTLGVEPGGRAPSKDVRDAVLGLRAGKGMVLDAADHDTWSAGSFFTNPFVAPEALPDGAPRWEQPDGTVKASAAWLIEQAGFHKGYGHGAVALSTKHTLALTNRGGATTEELLALAAEVRRGVHDRFGIWLVNEPMLVGCELPRA